MAEFGSIISALELEKKIIVVPRLSKYKEHTNDHQLDITSEFEKQNLIKVANDLTEFKKCLKEVKSEKTTLKKYISNNENFVKQLENYIDKIGGGINGK